VSKMATGRTQQPGRLNSRGPPETTISGDVAFDKMRTRNTKWKKVAEYGGAGKEKRAGKGSVASIVKNKKESQGS